MILFSLSNSDVSSSVAAGVSGALRTFFTKVKKLLDLFSGKTCINGDLKNHASLFYPKILEPSISLSLREFSNLWKQLCLC